MCNNSSSFLVSHYPTDGGAIRKNTDTNSRSHYKTIIFVQYKLCYAMKMEPFSNSSIGYTHVSSDLDLPILQQIWKCLPIQKPFTFTYLKRVSTVFLGLLFWTIKEPMHAVGVHSIVVACESPKDVPIKSIFLRLFRKKQLLTNVQYNQCHVHSLINVCGSLSLYGLSCFQMQCWGPAPVLSPL